MTTHPKVLHWAPTYASKTGTGLATTAWLRALVTTSGGGFPFEVVTTVKDARCEASVECPKVFGSESRVERLGHLRAALPGLDIVHFHGGFDPELSAALRYALAERGRRSGKGNALKVYITPHGSQSWQVFKRNRLKKLVYWHAVDKRLMSSVDAVVCNTPAEAEDMEIRLENTRCLVVPLALPQEYLVAGDVRERQREKNPDEPFMLCTLGRYDINMKGLDILIEAVRRINCHGRALMLRCIGYDSAGGTESLRRYATDIGCSRYVECAGPKWGRDKFQAVSDCDLFCVPSRYESFGYSAFDGLCAGLPILIGEGVCIGSLLPKPLRQNLSVQATPESWASTLDRVLGAMGEARNVSIEAQRILKETCDPAKIGDSLNALYRS